METKLIRILAIREKYPNMLGFTPNQRYVLGKLRTGAKLKDWRAMARFLKLTEVETGIMDGSLRPPAMAGPKLMKMETESVMDNVSRQVEYWTGWWIFEALDRDAAEEMQRIREMANL